MGVEKLNKFEKFKEGVEMANRAAQPGLHGPRKSMARLGNAWHDEPPCRADQGHGPTQRHARMFFKPNGMSGRPDLPSGSGGWEGGVVHCWEPGIKGGSSRAS
jgi:hypothetical protein